MLFKLVNSEYSYFLIQSSIPTQEWLKIWIIQNYFSVTHTNLK